MINNYNGILFVGDPHLWSKRPSKRNDADFADTVLNKISQAVNIALENNLYLIFLGDLFHSSDENDLKIITKLIRVLMPISGKCATVEGNHELSQTSISDDVALSILKEAGIIKVYETNDIQEVISVQDKKITIGSTPYGHKIPKKIKSNKSDYTIWLTHANLDFGDCYPGVIKVEEIEGVNMLVNGHIHKEKQPLKVGNMLSFNPGNITRLSLDCLEHEPAVWGWYFGDESLTKYTLQYNKNSFHPQTVVTLPNQQCNVLPDLSPIHVSQFVQHMEKQILEGEDLSGDGGHIKDSIVALAKAMDLDEDIMNDILDLASETAKNKE